jgi:hypothetical protein
MRRGISAIATSVSCVHRSVPAPADALGHRRCGITVEAVQVSISGVQATSALCHDAREAADPDPRYVHVAALTSGHSLQDDPAAIAYLRAALSFCGDDSDGNEIGAHCECGDEDLDGSVDVSDLVSINQAIFGGEASHLCDTNEDALCDVTDIVGANHKIFGAPAHCGWWPSLD